MSSWTPEVVIIEKLEKHPNADSLSIATVMGDHPVVVKTDDYQVGQLSSYVPIDTVVPDTAQFYFLCPAIWNKQTDADGKVISMTPAGYKFPLGSVPEKYRIIKSKKIRNMYSQGMLVPAPIGMSVGDSIVEHFGLTKWEEPEEEENIPHNNKKNHSQNEKKPEGWDLPYYDISNLRKYVNCIRPDEEIVLSEKLHGSCSAFSHDGEKLWVKSRNYYKRSHVPVFDGENSDPKIVESNDPWWVAARQLDLETKMKSIPFIALFGELYGKVKGFKYDSVNGEPKVRFFDAWDVKARRYLNYDDFHSICRQLELETVPELYRGFWSGKDMYALAEGVTTLGGKHVREGFVLRTTIERYEPRLDSRMCLKLVGEGYSLNK